ncbi:restriction endonuclease subunit S [Lactococcus muris]|uniref:Restriction endonuclease subunit S n=1 Tax=Lactococcus muris TaxID=2941330 RepID=A0ABV4D7X9_9LACT
MDYKLYDLAKLENGKVFPKDTLLTEEEKRELQDKGEVGGRKRCYLYTPAVFEYDRYLQKNSEGEEKYLRDYSKFLSVKAGDVVISPITQYATLVREHKVPMLLSPNHIKVSLDEKLIDKSYFVFWFNELPESRKQISEMKQGTTVIKLPTSGLKGMAISLPNLNQQKQLGTSYINSLKLMEQLKRKKDLQINFLKGINQQLIEREKKND